jgi:ligand-binding sensor protein/AraC-like DNA-binding protein
LQHYKLLDFAEKDVLLKILETFNSSTDLTAIIVDLDGIPLVMKENPLKSCEFCSIIRQNSEAKKRCHDAYARAGKLAAATGEPYIFRCPAGLIEWAAPIQFKGHHLSTIICGQVLMWEPEDFFWIELTMMNKKYGYDMGSLISAAQKLPVISGKKVQAAADLLFVIANQVIKTGFLKQQKNKIPSTSVLINELNQLNHFINNEYTNNKYKNKSSFSVKENELLASIKSSNTPQAFIILKDILKYLQNSFHNNPDIFKMHIIELLIKISETVFEKENNSEKILRLNYKYIQKINSLNSESEVINLASIIFEQYIKFSSNLKNKNSKIVKQVKDYIQENYHINLKLDDIANAVYISPYYLSHIFKKETGHTILEYLTKIRLNTAKKMLINSKDNVRVIALKVGYSNPSYFSKIFKNNEGLSPNQFRQKNIL